ncbi:MAG: hypothetical protein JWN76_483 [Chitinophagaceae bacterium]|nr:hypothetical protein [Chitinophagaceae bacterium]
MPTGKQLLQLANQHKGEKYVFGTLVPKNASQWKGPWDCAEFVSWVVYQLSTQLYGCVNDNGNPASADSYTGYWKRDADQLGKIITVEEAAQTQGAAILRCAANGVIGHIVISDGKGGTIEANSTRTGVINSVVSRRRWDIGVLIPWIDYTTKDMVEIADPTEAIYRFTTPLMHGPKIKKIQSALKGLGYHPGKIDGYYGSQTFTAVKSLQVKKGLVADGEVGHKTAKVLGLDL